ncbi:MAG: TIGR03915 family putative DNA repair protein [Treponema sp.]|jgi:probable DNA metabolism protein|nr:TIGR03915 family putative DNA repair protein [Treponema sp.]
MIENSYDGTLAGIFTVLDRIFRSPDPEAMLPDRVRAPRRRAWETRPAGAALSGDTASPAQPDLFGEIPTSSAEAISTGLPACLSPPDIPAAQYLYGLSAGAYDCFIHGWMSELPIEAELIRFAWKVLDAGRTAAGGLSSPEAREKAEAAAADRGDPDVRAVLSAAWKVRKELDRLRGLLRFSPDSSGIYLARCTPDHFVLPGLAGHFTLRFGETPWAILDERRSLALVRPSGEETRLITLDALPHSITVPGHNGSGKKDTWEELWRNYHRVINNESRNNPRLQRQFMPSRYRKYLPEVQE